MATTRIVVSDPKTRKAYQKEIDLPASGFLGKKIGENVPGAGVGLDGYTIQVTGGSDKEGFPMRRDIEGQIRKRIVLSDGPGFHSYHEGMRKRKSIRGNTIFENTMQINAKVVTAGSKSIEDAWGIKPKETSTQEKAEAKMGVKPVA